MMRNDKLREFSEKKKVGHLRESGHKKISDSSFEIYDNLEYYVRTVCLAWLEIFTTAENYAKKR